MQPLKCTEQFVTTSHIKPGPIVSNKIVLAAPSLLLSEFNARAGFLTCKFPGIVQQVFHDDLHEVWVRLYGQMGRNAEYHLALRLQLFQAPHDVSRHRAQIDCLELELCTGHTRE